MKRLTYAELTAEVTRLKASESLLHVALHLVNNARPNATERAYYDGGRYIFSLYGADRACGGIVVETYHHKKQTPQTKARYLDDLRRIEGLPVPLAAVIDRLRIVRDRVLDASVAA